MMVTGFLSRVLLGVELGFFSWEVILTVLIYSLEFVVLSAHLMLTIRVDLKYEQPLTVLILLA
jgi:hypothetical protein